MPALGLLQLLRLCLLLLCLPLSACTNHDLLLLVYIGLGCNNYVRLLLLL